ncbi:MAG: hypothetical protein E7393_01990 [Ruminococcaceae bacterium]|nr:hypothetical protein [Oscillospiraceae bacterium]
MVTLSIAEKDNTIATQLQHFLHNQGKSFCNDTLSNNHDYILITPAPHKKCDVVLVHNSSIAPCYADYMTILNADDTSALYNNKSLVVTYGFNSLATVTASSVILGPEQCNFLCCVQRAFVSLKGTFIEPQEIPITLSTQNIDIGTAMACVVLGLVLSIPTTKLNDFFKDIKYNTK